ncbi:MAG: hypothetical protein LBJ71_02285, partial [Holosporaceae bacterium]|nr:hypothetical protein [Holosporaceae bacterium]
MKKVFCIWLIIVFSFIPQSCCAFSLIPKKSTEVKSMDKVSSTANALAKLLASMSTSCDSFTQKNWAGEDDVSSLVALRICMKNFSELFYWVGR